MGRYLICVISLATVLFTAHSGATIYRVNVGQSQNISTCSETMSVTNNCSADIAVPTQTCGEWNAFKSGKPACVNVAAGGGCAAQYECPGDCGWLPVGNEGDWAQIGESCPPWAPWACAGSSPGWWYTCSGGSWAYSYWEPAQCNAQLTMCN